MTSLASRAMRGSVLRMLQTLTSILIGFWMLPFLFNNLGQDQYAVWVLIGSVIATFYLMDLGFSQAVTRYVARHIYANDFDAANRIINTSLVIYTILGIIILLVTLVVSSFAPELFETEFNDDEAIYLAVMLLGLSLALEFPSKAFPGIISAYMRFDTIAQVRMLINILRAVFIYIFVSAGHGIVAIAAITLVLNLFSTAFFVYYSQKLFKDIAYSWKYVKKEELHEIYHFSKWVFAMDTTFLLKDKIGLWVIAGFSLTPLLPIFYAAQRLVEYASQFLMQALGITGPIFTKFYAEKNTDSMVSTLSLFVKLYALFSMIIMCGFIVVGEHFLDAWMGQEFDSVTAYECLIVLAIGIFFTMMCAPYNSLLMTIKKHKYAAIIALIEIAVALTAAMLMMPEQGLLGVAIATGLLVGIVKVITLPMITARLFHYRAIPIILRSLTCFFLGLGLGFALSSTIEIEGGWLDTIQYGLLSLICSVIPGYLLFDKTERQTIKGWVLEKFKKNNAPPSELSKTSD